MASSHVPTRDFLSPALPSPQAKATTGPWTQTARRCSTTGTSEGRERGAGRRARPRSPERGAGQEPRGRSWIPQAPRPPPRRPAHPRPRLRPPPASPASPRPWEPWPAAWEPSPGAWLGTSLSGDRRRWLLTAPSPPAPRQASLRAMGLRPPAPDSATSPAAGEGPRFEGSPGTVPSAPSRGACSRLVTTPCSGPEGPQGPVGAELGGAPACRLPLAPVASWMGKFRWPCSSGLSSSWASDRALLSGAVVGSASKGAEAGLTPAFQRGAWSHPSTRRGRAVRGPGPFNRGFLMTGAAQGGREKGWEGAPWGFQLLSLSLCPISRSH